MTFSFASVVDAPPWLAFALCFVAFNVFMATMGFGAAVLLLPRRLRRYTLLLAPVVGFCFFGLAGWHLMLRDWPGTNAYWHLVFSLGAILTVAVAVLYPRFIRDRKEPLFTREVALIVACALLTPMILARPLHRRPKLTCVSFGNNDPASYAMVERYLQEFRLSEPADHSKEKESAKWLAAEAVPGVYLATAAFASATGVATFRLQVVCVAAYAFWLVLCCGVFLRHVLRFALMPALAVTACCALSSLTHHVAFQGFKAQLAASALYTAIAVVVFPVLLGRAERWGALPATVLLMFGLLLAYPHMFPLCVAALFPLLLLEAVRMRTVRPVVAGIGFLAVACAGTFLVSPFRMGKMVDYFFNMAHVVAGYSVTWMTPQTFLGLSGEGLYFLEPAFRSPGILVLSTGGLVVLWSAGLKRVRTSDPDIFIACLSLLITVLPAYLWLLFRGGEPFGYKAFKLLTFFLPLLICATFVHLRDLRWSLSPWQQPVRLALVVLLLAGTARAALMNAHRVSREGTFVSEDLAGLQALEQDPTITSINLTTDDFWESMWQSTFLFHKRLFRPHDTYYPATRPLEGEWTIVGWRMTDPVLRQPSWSFASVRPVNATYSLVQGMIHVDFDIGWYPSGTGARWTAAQNAKLIVQSDGRRQARLELRYRPIDPADELSVVINGSPAGGCGKDTCVLDAVELKRGRNVLELVSRLPPHLHSATDPRYVGVHFTRIALSPVVAEVAERRR